MDVKKRIDKILGSVHNQVKDEIGVLLGVGISVNNARAELVTKENFFDALVGKQILAKIDVAGEVEGLGCLVIGIKDAIRLGGTLIMLPDSELEEVIGREEYTEELEDSYGEIANIIAGSYTKVFEEMFPKACRFIRKEQEVVVPVKVDIESDEPVPDQQYYQVSCTLTMSDHKMGDLHMLMPAESFGLVSADAPQEPEVVEDKSVAEPAVGEAVPETAEETAIEDVTKAAEAAESPPKKAIDPVKHKKRLDKILGSCEKKLSEELSTLLGVEIRCSGLKNSYISKEDFFYEELEGKQVISNMEVVGDQQGGCYFFASLKDAIHLGGVLIMLPPSELETVVSEEEFSEDIKDSYGEVANIVSGVYTSVFEEQYNENLRFVKKDILQVIPMKVDVESDEPIADQQYYMSCMSLSVDGKDLGKVRMMFPAAMLHIAETAPTDMTESASQPQPAVEKAAPVTEAAEEQQVEALDAAPEVAEAGSAFDVAKHRKHVDKLLKECQGKMREEVSALLGAEITFEDFENKIITKEDFFFDVANGKQVMANLDVVGEVQGKSYLFVTQKDAIHMGGMLIMLPPSELESAVSEEEFSEDSRDAYGEIANIIAGVYTGVFEEQYVSKIRFVKTELEQVVPMKVDPESDEPFPDVEYYMSSMSLLINEKQHGRVNLLFPAELLKLDAVTQAESEAVAAAQTSAQAPIPPESAAAGSDDGVKNIAPLSHVPVDILIISDDEISAAELVSGAEQRGFTVRTISFKEDIRGAVTQELKAVYIVMRRVDEQAFGMIIKVNSSCSVPLIAAGPQWTKSKVIKAVKYGITDILLTPASGDDILENLDNNLVKLAA